jgi:5,10-methylene-tetrahydrofolate dehydrogenase/methenyl tetrahydrofolate cyclohydrolase
VSGSHSKDFKPLFTVPYKGTNLSGQSLKDQLDKWASIGTIEPDAAVSISKAVADKSVDLSGQHFVLIGAGSAMGPFTKLLEQGATVVCIDLPSKQCNRSEEFALDR